MRTCVLFALFFIGGALRSFSQGDSLAIQPTDHSLNNCLSKFGCSIFGGLGVGGNDRKTGSATGVSARIHYKYHTLNAYSCMIQKTESAIPKPAVTYFANSLGFTYGAGIYERSVAASVGVGIGFTSTTMKLVEGVKLEEFRYNGAGLCFGGQFSVHRKIFGFGTHMYLNVTDPITTYILLFGLEVTFR